MTALPDVIYVVIRHYGDFGIGCGDASDNEYDAYDQFAEAVADGEPVCVMEIRTTGSEPMSIRDITDHMEEALTENDYAFGVEPKPVIRFKMEKAS